MVNFALLNLVRFYMVFAIQGPTMEQKERLSLLMEQRKKLSTPKSKPINVKSEEIDKNEKSLEPDLNGLTPVFDFQMFREAQARAAEEIVFNQLF